MASEVGICNRALQKLGAKRITALTEDSKNARECAAAYDILRDAELRAHPWSFAVSRSQLAPDSESPAFEFDYQFTLPADCLRILPDNETTDWTVEGRKVLTNDGTSINLRYIARVEDPNTFDALFIEALACRIALELCEAITQSNSKKDAAARMYRDAISEARRANAFEKLSDEAPDASWITGRL